MALTPNKYQNEAYKTFKGEGIKEFIESAGFNLDNSKFEERAKFISFLRLQYLTGKLNGEAGEVAEEVFKSLRSGGDITPRRAATLDELGDVLWYVACIAKELNVSLEDIMEQNLGKVRARYRKGYFNAK